MVISVGSSASKLIANHHPRSCSQACELVIALVEPACRSLLVSVSPLQCFHTEEVLGTRLYGCTVTEGSAFQSHCCRFLTSVLGGLAVMPLQQREPAVPPLRAMPCSNASFWPCLVAVGAGVCLPSRHLMGFENQEAEGGYENGGGNCPMLCCIWGWFATIQTPKRLVDRVKWCMRAAGLSASC